MTEDTPSARGQPMYASYLTFVTLLDWLRETKHIPSQFDRSWWGSKFSGSGGAQLMAGLRFLGLLTKDEPQERLERLAFASNDERPALLVDILSDAYGADLLVGLARMTPKMLNDRISALGTPDATHRKAVAFFVNAAKAAKVAVPPAIAKQARNRPASSPAIRKPTGQKTPDAGSGKPAGDQPKPPASETALPKGIHAALLPFLADLVTLGPTWDQVDYRNWKETFDRVLLYAYPVQEPEDDEGQEAQ
jgi:hypothetical protein